MEIICNLFSEVRALSAYTMYIVWAAAIIGFAILEGITFQLVSIWFVFGSLAAFIASLLGASVTMQVIIWLVVSVLALAITRPIVKKKLTAKIQPTNADRCIGSDATVLETIDNARSVGQVKVDGKVWSARSLDGGIIEENTVVTVKKIEGVKLLVAKK